MKILTTLLLALFSLAALADEAEIRKTLTERYQKMTINSVKETPVPGIYEVYSNGQIVYSDAKGEHLFIGPLVKTATRTNLTQERLADLNRVDFSKLPMDKAFTVVHGKGERHIAVFSDPDCPHCKKLERELGKVDNLTVHVFLMPLQELHPGALEISRNVWCAADRAQAWKAYMLEGKKPEAATCETPVDAIGQLAGELGIGGTPAIILSDGRRLSGAVPAKQIEEMLGGS